MKGKGFRQTLADRQKKVNSLVCVGIDPKPEKLPECIKGVDNSAKILSWMTGIIDATAPFTSMYKPNRAFFEAIGGGRTILQNIISHIHNTYPDILVFLDCKRGDIGNTQARYAEAHFELDGADGMNFSPYMGKDCMSALVDLERYPGKAIVGLCYTSNPAARQVQDIRLPNGDFYWEFIAKIILGWAKDLGVVENAGLVMAAAHKDPQDSELICSRHLSSVREIVGSDLWFLIPGIGTQGGFIAETVKAAFVGWGSIAINSSSGIIFASSGEDYAQAAADKTEALRDQIREAGGSVE